MPDAHAKFSSTSSARTTSSPMSFSMALLIGMHTPSESHTLVWHDSVHCIGVVSVSGRRVALRPLSISLPPDARCMRVAGRCEACRGAAVLRCVALIALGSAAGMRRGALISSRALGRVRVGISSQRFNASMHFIVERNPVQTNKNIQRVVGASVTQGGP